MLARDRLPHALLFSGPAGMGKYTAAQMLAKAIHCLQRQDDFCGECSSCRNIAQADDRWAAVDQAEADREKLTKRPREMALVIQNHPDVVLLAPNGPLPFSRFARMAASSASSSRVKGYASFARQ